MLDEKRRIPALAAMHALGNHDTMAHLSRRVRLERSPRVRRMMVAVLVDYFGPSIVVGGPRMVGQR